MHRLLAILFLLANQPEAEKKLEYLNSLILTTRDSVKSIKGGLDNFHAMMMSISPPAPPANKYGGVKTKPAAGDEAPETETPPENNQK